MTVNYFVFQINHRSFGEWEERINPWPKCC